MTAAAPATNDARPVSGPAPAWSRLAAGLVAALVVLVYLPASRGPFLYDDIFEIENNPALETLWPPTVPMFGGPPFPKRPIPSYTFAIDRAVHGLDTFGFHVVNVAIHLLNGLLAWWVGTALLVRPWLGCDATRVRAGIPAGVAAAAWLVHPLATQPVAYIYQRIELLGATAILATLAGFLRSLQASRPAAWQTATLAACAAGMLCKETVVAAPLLVLLVDALAVQQPHGGLAGGIGRSLRRRPVLHGALWGTIAIAVWVVWVQADVYRELTAPSWTTWEYLATQPAALARYLRLVVLPVGQCFDYGWTPTASPVLRLCGIAVLALVIGLTVIWSGRLPGPALVVTGFLVLVAPTSSLIPVNDLCVEHRMYLPSFVVLLAATAAGACLAGGREWAAPQVRRTIAVVGPIAVIALLAAVSVQRVGVYRSLLDVWSDAAAKAPENARAHLWVGIALAERGRDAEAFAAFGESIARGGGRVEAARAHAWRAAILGRAGRPAEAHAEALLATERNPREPLGWANLARAAADLGRRGDAMAACRRALTLDPTLPPTARLLARLENEEPVPERSVTDEGDQKQ